jgi:hypothetical protein
MIIPNIIWEKWIDPFGENTDDAKWTDYDNSIEDIESSYADDADIPKPSKPIKVIASPMGLIPYNEYTASSKIFNFWIGHTNFNISELVKDTIDNCPGIEILDIFTRYRFRIAIGKCFNDSEVMTNVTNKIIEVLAQHGIQQQ